MQLSYIQFKLNNIQKQKRETSWLPPFCSPFSSNRMKWPWCKKNDAYGAVRKITFTLYIYFIQAWKPNGQPASNNLGLLSSISSTSSAAFALMARLGLVPMNTACTQKSQCKSRHIQRGKASWTNAWVHPTSKREWSLLREDEEPTQQERDDSGLQAGQQKRVLGFEKSHDFVPGGTESRN